MAPAPDPSLRRPLRRCPHHRVLGGVAAGAADHFDVDPAAIRIGLVLFALLGGLAVPLYAAAWVLIPAEDENLSIAESFIHRHVAA